MRLNPLLTAAGVGLGSMVAMGGTTIVVSGVAISIAKRATRQRMLKDATACAACQGEGYLPCNICMGKCVLRCRAPRTLTSIMQDSKSDGCNGDGATAYCSCPACGTSGYQRCLNCLGDGKTL